ncbi:hypothetical protein ILYODFUR_026730 [Ilyodon furcidens]|uniref:Uncharacterized protein n=1 Tax=Ilyodon furcidens TaxID=33524 RepID=A0ABV0SPG4_9TELE
MCDFFSKLLSLCATQETTVTKVHGDLKMHFLKIYVCHKQHWMGIILKRIIELTNLCSVARVCSLLLGMIYTLNLNIFPNFPYLKDFLWDFTHSGQHQALSS